MHYLPGDKGDDADLLRHSLRDAGAVPPISGWRSCKRATCYDKKRYRGRHLIEDPSPAGRSILSTTSRTIPPRMRTMQTSRGVSNRTEFMNSCARTPTMAAGKNAIRMGPILALCNLGKEHVASTNPFFAEQRDIGWEVSIRRDRFRRNQTQPHVSIVGRGQSLQDGSVPGCQR
ncbi:hypothetical protein J2W42_003942 [Rhizobium tibeticum]|nr:hypothetical protein [Rhizobium tibeticum]